jgi:hypothetical protein
VAPHYEAVATRAEHRCEYCRAPEAPFNFRFEVEHIWPRSLERTSFLENLALACRACNLFKQNRTTAIDPEQGNSVSLFHPRREHWEDHFTFDAESQHIQGITPTGRATVALLQMNSELALGARRLWITLELFP